MKTEIEEKIAELNQRKAPVVVIDPALEKDKDVVYFPKKLKQANEMLKTAKLPELKERNYLDDSLNLTTPSSDCVALISQKTELFDYKLMTVEDVRELPEIEFNDSWIPAIEYFKNRFNQRYFNQIKVLQKDPLTKTSCGFIVTSIDCILIETLEQFYEGEDEIKDADNSYFNFFNRSIKLNGVFGDKKDAGKFFGIIRSGLLHQAKTKKASKINIKKNTPIIKWINQNEKHQGFEINRNLFHDCVIEEFRIYMEKLKAPGNDDLRKKFKDKLLTIL